MEVLGPVPESVNCHTCGAAIPLAGKEGFAHTECPHCGAAVVVPVRFGQYLLVAPLGIGGMGTVYKAVDLSLHRYCAIKIVRPEAAANPEFVEQFSREARAAAAVTHLNIAQVYSFGQHDGRYYLAMELLEKGSLDDRINAAGALPEDVVLEIGRQIAHGLRAALQRGLLHLDVKPANILFSAEGDAKLVDFGLAHMQEKQRVALRRAALPAAPVAPPAPDKAVWGTPYYVAPEKLRGQPEDFRSDIYSLGATLFHALAGRPLLETETDDGTTANHLRRPGAALKALRPDLHEATIRVIDRMLARNPASRPASYNELIYDLEAAHAALKRAATGGQRDRAASTNSLVRSLILTAGMVTVGLAAGWLVWQHRENLPELWQKLSAKLSGTPAPPTLPAAPPPPEPGPAPVTVPVTTGTVNLLGDEPWAKAWQDATAVFAAGKYAEAQEGYQAIREKILQPEQTAAHQWVTLFESLTLFALDRTNDVPPLAIGALDAHTLAQPLLQLCAGRVTPQQMEEAVHDKPAWVNALTQLVIGFARVGARQWPDAAAAFRAYAAQPKLDQEEWVYSLQPLAANLAVECAAPAEIAALEAEQKFIEALEKWRAAQEQATLPAVRAALADRAADLPKAAEQQQAALAKTQDDEAKKRQDNEEHQRQLLEADTALLQQTDRSLLGRWERYEFHEAAAQYAGLKEKLQTDTGRKQLANREALVELLAEFKAQLAKDFEARPYDATGLATRGAPLVGQLVRATDAEIFLHTPHGEIAGTWANFEPAALAKVGDHYAATLGKAEPRRYLLLAAFCNHYRLAAAAKVYAEALEKTAPALKEQLDALFAP